MTTKSQQPLDVPQLVLEAIERCQDYLSPTPLEYSLYLSEKIDGQVWLKLDSMQRTTSFKFRGAINKILSLTEAELDKGVISASTGNYALAVAEAIAIRKRRATIYVAEDLDQSRLELLRAHGLDLVIHGEGAWDAEKEARRVASEEGKIYVSPYNDPIVVGGQGTCGYEISKQLPDLDAALFACGGAGLLTGSAGWLKSHNPEVEVFGVSPENSPVMYESMRANKIVEMETTPHPGRHLRWRRGFRQHHAGAVSAICGGDHVAHRKGDRVGHPAAVRAAPSGGGRFRGPCRWRSHQTKRVFQKKARGCGGLRAQYRSGSLQTNHFISARANKED